MNGSKSSTHNELFSQGKSHDESGSHNLEIILEKNRTIEMLTQRLYNQKIQLEYYIKKELTTAGLLDIVENCPSQFSIENINVAFAVNKFCKDYGIKGHLTNLYESVYGINDRASLVLEALENLVEVMIGLLRDSVRPSDVMEFLGHCDINILYINLFNQLITAMTGLKETLTVLEHTCENVGKVEDKRNGLVDYVYSLPMEEQAIYRHLAEVQAEKSNLERTLKDVLRSCRNPEGDNMCSLANNIKLLHTTTISHVHDDNPEDAVDISEMLEAINTQAMALLTLSEEQKDKYTKEISQLKEENDELRRIIQNAGTSDFNNIDRSDGARRKPANEQSINCQKKERTCDECEKLKVKLLELEEQRLQMMNFLSGDDYQMNFNYTAQLGIIRRGGNSYQSQVDLCSQCTSERSKQDK